MQNTSQTIGPEAFITPGVVAHVESVARTIIAIYDFNREDFDDICHDFYLEILNYAGQYTPGLCSPETYACRRVDWYKKQVVKRLSERKRTMSFSEIMTDDDENEDDVIPFENETAENTVERLSLRLDVLAVVASLPPQYRLFCQRIMNGDTMREAAKAAHFAWGFHVQRIVLPFLRKKFEEAGICKDF